MATYFPSSNNDRDAPPMNYMREAGGSYSEAPALRGTMMYMNYASSSGSYSDTLAANSQQQNTCVDIPQSGALDSNVSHHEFLSNLGGSRISEHDFSTWRDARSEMMLMQPMGGASSIVLGDQNLQGQGLSLSLSPQLPSGIRISSMQYRNPNPGFSSFLGPNASISGDDVGRNGPYRDDETCQSKQLISIEYVQPDVPGSSSDFMKGDVSPYIMSNITRNIPSSKYLKAAQQLLDEVVNVGTALKQHDCKKVSVKDPKEVDGASKENYLDSSNVQESSSNAPTELSVSEKQEMQNKMSKLLSMLDEVGKRYRQYFHQMQIVVSSFDVIAGCGAAKPYTALALQTISRHFRCLRDAINGQIRVTQRSLGEQDGSSKSKGVGISRLRYIDQQLRQQRALQQLGMMQQHIWRPQRGLPESSVTILRAWLFEHFLHPYPKDSDKIMLARQTGLTRSQVSNWFINARVRLWKPMVEEMYKEEAGDAEMDSNSSSDIALKAMKGDQKTSEDGGEDLQNSATSTATEQRGPGQFFQPKPRDAPDVEMVGPCSESSFRIVSHGETETQYHGGKPRGDQTDSIVFSKAMAEQNERNERFMAAYHMSELGQNERNERFMAAYHMSELGQNERNERFMAAYHMSELGRTGNRGGVSLTLGLQNCEDGSVPMPVGNYHNFVTMRGEDVYAIAAPSLGNENGGF